MKFPLIIASDFSGLLESLFLAATLLVTLILSSVAMVQSFFIKLRSASRRCAIVCLWIFGIQALGVVVLFADLPSYRRQDNWQLPVLCLIPVAFVSVAFVRTRPKPNHAPEPMPLKRHGSS